MSLEQQLVANMLMNKLVNQGLMGSALVGGKRRKTSAWQKKVGAYARKHGVSAAKAAHHLKGGDEDYEDDYDDLFSEGRRHRRRKKKTTRGGAKSRLGLTEDDLYDLIYDPKERAEKKVEENKWLKAAKLYQECEVPKKNASKAELKRYYERCVAKQPNPKTVLKYALKGLLKNGVPEYANAIKALKTKYQQADLGSLREQQLDKILKSLTTPRGPSITGPGSSSKSGKNPEIE